MFTTDVGRQHVCVALYYVVLPTVLTACDIRQSAEFPSLVRVSSVAPRPVFIGFTAVIWGFSQGSVWQIGRIIVVTMRRLWVPSLTCTASGSHGDCTRVTDNIHVIAGAFVWKTVKTKRVIVYRINKCTHSAESTCTRKWSSYDK